MSDKNKHKSANDYLQYLKGELSSQERHTFEKGLEADPFEKEAMEGLESLETEQAEQDILSLHMRLRKRLSRRRRVAFYSVAATVASLLIVGTVFLKIHDFTPGSDEKQVYSEESFDSEVKAEEPVSPIKERTQEPSEEVVLEEVEPAIVVEEVRVAEPEKLETYDIVISEDAKLEPEVSMMAAPAPMNKDLEEDQITHIEAEPMAGAVEREEVPEKKIRGRQKKSMAQPAAQTLSGKVSGIVISAEDQGPIPGAIVENRALNSVVFTDQDGRFDIAVQEDSPSTLVASFIGMETQEYHVSDGDQVELLLQPDATTLDEVMVVSYASREEAFPTGEKGSDYTVPEPVIGTKNYKQYLEQNIEFPQVDSDSQRAVVVLKFIVTHKGELKEIVALKTPGDAFTREATRLLMEGPDWNPAKTDKGTKDESVRMRIVFKR